MRPSRTRLWTAGLLALMLAACQSQEEPGGTAISSTSAESPAERCARFAGSAFEGLTISETEAVTDREDLPGFCAIRGTIDPDIGFEARFPLTGWNGKFYQSGCGGYCGRVMPDKAGFSNTINEALKRGYASITTDAGHRAWLGDASWASGNPVAVEVYAHRVRPRPHAAGTGMVEAFYGEPARLDYFGGCSNGGRLAAMAAQRYPDLFDGILGGGAVLDLSRSGGIYGSWVVQVNSGPDGERILNRRNFAHKLPLLERLVVAQCDATDGRADGVISQPRQCEVDLEALPRCAAEGDESCFRERELAVVKKWYQGPRDSAGNQLFPGMPPGSERYWAVWFLDPEDRTAPGNALGGNYAKYLGFEDGAPESFTALDFDFDTDPARLAANGLLLNALDPDLSAFRDGGGKYLLWHGWQDPLVLPDQTVDWYAGILGQMGGASEVDSFLRLFMIPGMGHCWEMPSSAPDRFDPITVLDNWVERGQAPERLELLALDPESAGATAAVVCPYPGEPVFLDRTEDRTEDYCAGMSPE
jgi:feruloyl esterase